MVIVIYPQTMERAIMIYGQLEIEIMNVIWDMQEENEDVNISIADIVSALTRNNLCRAYTTIKTVMDRLVTKEILVRYKNGKKFFYKSTIDRDEACKQVMDTISSQFFSGSYVKMIKFIERKYAEVLV